MSSEEGADKDAGAALNLQTGPYILRDLLTSVPLSEDGEGDDTKITCVEFWSEYSVMLDRSVRRYCSSCSSFKSYSYILSQMTTSTSARLPPRSSTTCLYLARRLTPSPRSSLQRDCQYQERLRAAPMAFSRYSSYLKHQKPVYSVMAP